MLYHSSPEPVSLSETLSTDLQWFCIHAVYDYQFTNSDNCVFNKIVFISWCALLCCSTSCNFARQLVC